MSIVCLSSLLYLETISMVCVGSTLDTVCLSVCPQHNLKTNDPEVFLNLV